VRCSASRVSAEPRTLWTASRSTELTYSNMFGKRPVNQLPAGAPRRFMRSVRLTNGCGTGPARAPALPFLLGLARPYPDLTMLAEDVESFQHVEQRAEPVASCTRNLSTSTFMVRRQPGRPVSLDFAFLLPVVSRRSNSSIHREATSKAHATCTKLQKVLA
jgi:hypothetical protein